MRLSTGKERVLVIPDLQVPYQHRDAMAFVQTVGESVNPTKVVCVGDEVDQMALSRFDPDPDGDGPGVELQHAIRGLAPWYEAFPEVDVCTSNHTERVYKRAFRAGIPEAYLRPVREWLNAPAGWNWENHYIIEGVKYEHGDAQGGMYAARHLAVRNRRSTVIGHHHSHGSVVYIANDDELIFGLNVGCLIDVDAIAFKYGKHSAFKPVLGCGVVLQGVPYFIPMLLNGRKRWTGEVIL
jgi:hypothetical protein